jgi:hypothetical protein
MNRHERRVEAKRKRQTTRGIEKFLASRTEQMGLEPLKCGSCTACCRSNLAVMIQTLDDPFNDYGAENLEFVPAPPLLVKGYAEIKFNRSIFSADDLAKAGGSEELVKAVRLTSGYAIVQPSARKMATAFFSTTRRVARSTRSVRWSVAGLIAARCTWLKHLKSASNYLIAGT